jgi:hypothetical protein
MGTETLPGVNQLGREADHKPPSSAEVKDVSTALICIQSVQGKLLFYLSYMSISMCFFHSNSFYSPLYFCNVTELCH